MKTLFTLAAVLLFPISFLVAQTPVVGEAIPIEQIVAELNNPDTESEAVLHLPYPVIFVHGLSGDRDTWKEFKEYAINNGLTYGGELPYCLNYDADNTTCNINSSASIEVYSFIGQNSSVSAGDFYIINFDTDPDGTSYGDIPFLPDINNSVLSNQAAIVKQALALKHAVGAVMQLSGRDKVILFGHSMGGLASRSYLQIPQFFQPDGEHHVAKLITSGTPHGGSNISASLLSQIFGINEKSEAVRDLRKTYYVSNAPGVLLYGGNQTYSIINDSEYVDFYNIDVDCDGTITDAFVGMNNRTMPHDLDIVSLVANDGIDIVVPDAQENFQLYFPTIHAEAFYIQCSHLDMPEIEQANLVLLDEPDDYYLSYDIAKNTQYTGYFTEQGDGANWPAIDYDDYLFTMTQAGFVKLVVNNVPANNAEAFIYKSPNFNLVAGALAGNSNSMETSLTWLTSGEYYLELAAEPSANSWQFPYTFEIQASGGSSVADAPEWVLSATLAPNPATDYTTISATFGAYTEGIITLTDALGRIVQSQSFTGDMLAHSFDLADAVSGAYFVTVRTAMGVKSWTLLKL